MDLDRHDSERKAGGPDPAAGIGEHVAPQERHDWKFRFRGCAGCAISPVYNTARSEMPSADA
jgi:hypothetical protein